MYTLKSETFTSSVLMINFEINSRMLRCVAGFVNFVWRYFIHGGRSSGVFPCFINKNDNVLLLHLKNMYHKALFGLNTFASDLFHFRGYVVPVHVPNKIS